MKTGELLFQHNCLLLTKLYSFSVHIQPFLSLLQILCHGKSLKQQQIEYDQGIGQVQLKLASLLALFHSGFI